MLALLLLPYLFGPSVTAQDPVAPTESPPVIAVSFKWFKDRQPAENVAPSLAPQPEMNDANKNMARQRRQNASAGDRDPNLDSMDGRSAALDKIVQDSRESPPIDGFTYAVRFQNLGALTTQTVFWEYQFKETGNATSISRRRFVCAVKIKPQKQTDLRVFSTLGPSNVIDVKNLSKGSGEQFQESVVIDRVEYADGTSWERKDWNSDEVKVSAQTRSNRITPCRSF
jgi:hypothetical protein